MLPKSPSYSVNGDAQVCKHLTTANHTPKLQSMLQLLVPIYTVHSIAGYKSLTEKITGIHLDRRWGQASVQKSFTICEGLELFLAALWTSHQSGDVIDMAGVVGEPRSRVGTNTGDVAPGIGSSCMPMVAMCGSADELHMFLINCLSSSMGLRCLVEWLASTGHCPDTSLVTTISSSSSSCSSSSSMFCCAFHSSWFSS